MISCNDQKAVPNDSLDFNFCWIAQISQMWNYEKYSFKYEGTQISPLFKSIVLIFAIWPWDFYNIEKHDTACLFNCFFNTDNALQHSHIWEHLEMFTSMHFVLGQTWVDIEYLSPLPFSIVHIQERKVMYWFVYWVHISTIEYPVFFFLT